MNATRSIGKPAKRRRGRTRTSSAGPATSNPSEDALNPGLQGVAAGSRYDARRQEPSIEDPLQDWPEDGAPEGDDWLLDRDGRRASDP